MNQFLPNFYPPNYVSPIIHAIKIECSEGYKLCLRDNPANLYACSKELQAFADCAKDILRKAKTEGKLNFHSNS